MARNKFDVDEILNDDTGFKISNLTRMKVYIAPYKKRLILTLIAMFILIVFSLLSPYFFKLSIDTYIPNKDMRSIIIISLILLVTQGANVFLIKYRVTNMTIVGQGIIRDLRRDIFIHLQKLPFSYYDSRPHGKILVRVVNYINSLSDMFSNGLLNLITELFSLIVIVIIMFYISVELSLVSLMGLPILIIGINIIKIKQRKAWQLQSAKSANLNAYIHESIAGMKVTQSFAREVENANIFEKVSNALKSSWHNAIRIMFLSGPLAENISVWTISIIYISAAFWFERSTVSLGVLVAMIGYSGRFWAPISNLAGIFNSIIVNMAYLERIFELLDEPTVVNDIEGAVELPLIQGDVTFKDVTFGYEVGQTILNKINFQVNKGETIALVGPTGAGKTTVVNLLSRFYNINSGEVLFDNNNIANVTLYSLRKQMGIMLQDSFIFSGTIMDNIRYGKLEATDEEVMEAAKTVMAHDFIMEMEEGYLTEVNERGTRLSVGERQLISFARALLSDPKILILDEATSSIDTETEKQLQLGLDQLLKGRTSFIIAHRLSTIKNADKIMYIDKGTVYESGNHEQLMKLKGAYYNLYTAQYTFLNSL